MSRDKQTEIEEMAKDMCEYYHEGTCYQDKKPCDCKCDIFTDAQYLYSKGYRKASEVAREVIEDFWTEILFKFIAMCNGKEDNTLNLLQIDSALKEVYDSQIDDLEGRTFIIECENEKCGVLFKYHLKDVNSNRVKCPCCQTWHEHFPKIREQKESEGVE